MRGWGDGFRMIQVPYIYCALGIILRVLRVWREPIKLLYPKVFPSTNTHSPTPNITGQSRS